MRASRKKYIKEPKRFNEFRKKLRLRSFLKTFYDEDVIKTRHEFGSLYDDIQDDDHYQI
jgi:hypothetical protein